MAPESLMPLPTVGILHPGTMGAAVALHALRNAKSVLWYPDGRSAETRLRADSAGLTAASSILDLVRACDIIVSLCPPANAIEVAAKVAAESFGGLYVEANAIAPETVAGVSRVLAGRATVVDAAVIGSPPVANKMTELYVSGCAPDVAIVTALFDDTNVIVRKLPGNIGQASALKLSFSAYQKAARVLAAIAHAAAEEYGVEGELRCIAGEHRTNYLADVDYIPKVAARSWRWAPELREVSAMLRGVELPPELADATASVMERWADSKEESLSVPEALARLRPNRPKPQVGGHSGQ